MKIYMYFKIHFTIYKTIIVQSLFLNTKHHTGGKWLIQDTDIKLWR